ncbi:PIN domain-like protein [Atractiella rhizophila]|nr:PIN domain-like protein [Atractiella rhizophila]
MGVKGLWQVLSPVARPINVETLGNKKLAIDSSIWLYQFQSAMRDKSSGRALTNAHILGFLRRICKLLYHGIKPVFVFDGGAPVLKKKTIAGRKSRKRGAAESLTKTAEKLLAAQLREAAVKHVQRQKLQAETGDWVDEDDVYLDDLGEVRPSRKRKPEGESATTTPPKKKKYVHRDEYELPKPDAGSTSLHQNVDEDDPRLATEAELRDFIEELRPEDFDLDSEVFANLPVEVKYEIVGDLRIKSRQVNHKRVEFMKQSATPLDFSRAQIDNLKQRNELTQQILNITDNIENSHLSIPVRIAAQKNKEYVLIKSDASKGGGWVLGVQDKSASLKKDKELIHIDDDDDPTDGSDSDDEIEFEEVVVEKAPVIPPRSPDKAARKARTAEAIRQRYAPPPQSNAPKPNAANPRTDKSLFLNDSDEDDTEMAMTIKELEHLEQEQGQAPEAPLASPENKISTHNDTMPPELGMSFASSATRAIFASRSQTPRPAASARSTPAPTTTALPVERVESKLEPVASTSRGTFPPRPPSYLLPSAMGGAKSSSQSLLQQMQNLGRQKMRSGTATPAETPTSKPTLLPQPPSAPLPLSAPRESGSSTVASASRTQTFDDAIAALLPSAGHPQLEALKKAAEEEEIDVEPIGFTVNADPDWSLLAQIAAELPPSSSVVRGSMPRRSDEEELETDIVDLADPDEENFASVVVEESVGIAEREGSVSSVMMDDVPVAPPAQVEEEEEEEQPPSDIDPDEESAAAQLTAEQASMGDFYSQLRSRNLDEMRAEAEAEVSALTAQRNLDRRDQDEITLQMNSEIQELLRLFGLPYVVAPMEAEAQCAQLYMGGLVDGIITDDSDVFLFGGSKVYKNMFNQAKYVEMYLLADAERDLALDRGALIRLAYFLGSDYTEGIKGIGPVMGMELLKEFEGEHGVVDFRRWWTKVQTGRDTEEDTDSKFKKRFKRLKSESLYLDDNWPNSEVADAYLNPTTDTSPESFTWGFPDLDGIRSYLTEHLGWGRPKSDEILLPLMKRMNARPAVQGTLNNFFESQPQVRSASSTSTLTRAKTKASESTVKKGRGKRVGRQM